MQQEDRQEKREHSGGKSGEVLSVLVPLLRDFVPILIERWSDLADRPTLRSLEEENRRLRDQIDGLEKKVQWLTVFQVVTGIFLLFLIVLLATGVI